MKYKNYTAWCIMKHIKGTGYDHDCYVLTSDYKIKKFLYKESAEYECSLLNMQHDDCSYYVVRW